MLVTLYRKALTRALDALSKVVLPRHSLPILECAKLAFTRDALTATACDLERELSIRVPLEDSDLIAATPWNVGGVSLKALRLTLRGGESDRVSIEAGSTERNTVRLTVRDMVTGHASDFETLDPAEYPEPFAWEGEGEGGGGTIAAGRLAEVLEFVGHAQSIDETRYNLNGVYLEGKPGAPGYGIATATDGHRLASIEFADATVAGWVPQEGLILPRPVVDVLRSLLPIARFSPDSVVYIDTAARERDAKAPERISFRFDMGKLVRGAGYGRALRATLTARLDPAASFPNWRQILESIARRDTQSVRVDRAAILGAVEHVARAVGGKRKVARFARVTVNGDVMLEAAACEAKAEARCACERAEGELLQFGMNANYLADALRAFEAPRVSLGVFDASSPVSIGAEATPDRVAVIMPARV